MSERKEESQAFTRFQQRVQHIMDAVQDGDGSVRNQITPAIGVLMLEDAARELLVDKQKLAGLAYLRVSAGSGNAICEALDESPLRVVSLRMQGPRQAGDEHVAYVWVKHHGAEQVVRFVLSAAVGVRDYTIYD
jgi:hypothetical protein